MEGVGARMKEMTVEQLFQDLKIPLQLEIVSESAESALHITTADVHRPGLLLAGFTENFLNERIQILGETEMPVSYTHLTLPTN